MPWPLNARDGCQSLVVDYLHYGDALICFDALRQSRRSRFLAEIVHQRCGDQPAGVCLDELEDRLRESASDQTIFRRLGCRGFSFAIDPLMTALDEQWDRRFQLREEVDLRIAMMPAHWPERGGHRVRQWLFYPRTVRCELEKMSYLDSHYMLGTVPAIAVALGQKRREGWVILAMQSDAASHAAACVREHFRGWRKVLLAGISALAAAEGREVLLSSAREVARAVESRGDAPAKPLPSWTAIYDRTASELGMELVELHEAFDIRLYRASSPVMSSKFYREPPAFRTIGQRRSLLSGSESR